MEKNKCGNRYLPKVRDRAVRLVFEHQGEFDSQSAAIKSIAPKIGCGLDTLRAWGSFLHFVCNGFYQFIIEVFFHFSLFLLVAPTGILITCVVELWNVLSSPCLRHIGLYF